MYQQSTRRRDHLGAKPLGYRSLHSALNSGDGCCNHWIHAHHVFQASIRGYGRLQPHSRSMSMPRRWKIKPCIRGQKRTQLDDNAFRGGSAANASLNASRVMSHVPWDVTQSKLASRITDGNSATEYPPVQSASHRLSSASETTCLKQNRQRVTKQTRATVQTWRYVRCNCRQNGFTL
jgi:hypothetical protein